MPDWLSIHEPILINTIGHCAGALIFGMLLYYLLLNLRRAGDHRSILPVVAAALAMLWNAGSLVALATGPRSGVIADIIVAASFSVLSLLPAVLLHISLEGRHRTVWLSGYALSAVAMSLHVSELFTRSSRLHAAALSVVTVGFSVLTVVSVFLELRERNRAAGSRLAGTMGLFLFAVSFVHFGAEHSALAWSKEIAFHHAGLPLALLVLLQDYRFLMLDAFVRFVVNASLAAAAVMASIWLLGLPQLSQHLQHPFEAGLLFVSACLLLTLFVWIRNRAQRFLTSVMFLRSNVDDALRELQDLSRAVNSDAEYPRFAAEIIARTLHAARFDLTDRPPLIGGGPDTPATVVDLNRWNVPQWAQAVLPLRFSRGDAEYLMLGQRGGGRRYLSEDLSLLARLGSAVVGHVEQLRGVQMQNLVTQAELKALQAQINPHFLFNSLNALYGTIDRGNSDARRLVLNLAELFRSLLRSERTFVTVEEEVKIVRAYLEIEQIRLGPRLQTEFQIDNSLLQTPIPLLSIQPLVENAVKHGVASRSAIGFVRLTVTGGPDAICVEVENSGEFEQSLLTNSPGIGLANVRRRLALCYGDSARFDIRAGDGVTMASFILPSKPVPDLEPVAAAV